MRSVIASSLLIFLSIFQLGRSLKLEENRPGAIPNLSQNVNELLGGHFAVDLSNSGELDYLRNLLDQSIDKIQSTGNAEWSAKKHKLIKIKEANSQVVAGTNYDLVFTVGEIDAQQNINTNGEYGHCYFKVFVPLGSSPIPDVKEKTCVKVNRDSA